MNSSWAKYFTPGYSNLQEIKSTKNEFWFFGGLSLLITVGVIIHLKQTQLDTDNLNFLISNRPGIAQKLEIVEAENSILESQILIQSHEFTSIIQERASKILKNYNSLLALEETSGEGVIINLNDSTKPLTPGENPNLMIVHNLDILAIVNELWASGAKAVSINDQRITATTEFNCIGPIILVNNSRIMPPFTIKAVGDPEKMSETVKNGYIRKYNLEKYGINFSISKKDSITIPATSKTVF
jgi:uncharacterized protein YlxW (UPF0749 family)